MDAASENIVPRRVSSIWWDYWRRWGKWPLIDVMRFLAAAMMTLAGVAVGFERYLCFVKNGCRHSGCAGVNHPNLPCSVVFERGAKDVSLSTVCGKGFLMVWFVVH